MTEQPVVGPLITIGDPTNADLCVDGWCGPVDARPEPDTRIEGRSTMITIEATEQERATGVLSDEHRRTAAEALRTDGLVVLAEVVDPGHLDLLHERMITDLAALQARPDTPYNWNAGNLSRTRHRSRPTCSPTCC